MRFLFCPTASLKKLVWLVVLLMIPLTGYAQDARGKLVTLKLERVTLKQFFDEIHAQTGVDFFYTVQQARSVEPVTVRAEKEPLGQVLDRVLGNSRLEYTTEGNIITLRYKQNTTRQLVSSSASDEPKIEISGYVIDESGEPVAGAAVWVMNTKIGVMTAADGSYNVSVPASQSDITLRFTCIGMEPVEKKYEGNQRINVKMLASAHTLEATEVVATRYVCA